MTNRIRKALFWGITIPVTFLLNAFLVPEPYSHPLIGVGLAPTKLMPFLEDKDLMGELTIFVFGRVTPNYAPISIIFLVFFWFLFGVAASLIAHSVAGAKKNA